MYINSSLATQNVVNGQFYLIQHIYLTAGIGSSTWRAPKLEKQNKIDELMDGWMYVYR